MIWKAVAMVFMTGVALGVESADRPAAPAFPPPMSATEIQLALQKLNVLGRVLYIAAHPDDENTNLMALWANGSLYDAAYLSATRGDGGQNLIGRELREKLGVIRTHELLAARRLDHGRQFFTRAVDFGFSKNAEETLRIWDRDKILSDMVWVIRRFRPDVVVTRFSPEDDKTHGHHTASAILAREAFAAAGDPKRFPEQLAQVEIWKPVRLVWNTSPFFFSNRNMPFDPAGLATLEAGGFNPLLGKAFTEIAAASLSMHKSQGVGSPPRRGARKEYFKVLEGAPITSGLFDGVETTWARVPASKAIAEKISQVTSTFVPADPAAAVPKLLELRQALTDKISLGGTGSVPSKSMDATEGVSPNWYEAKRNEVDSIIAGCLGLSIESSSTVPAVSGGQPLPIKFEAINRSKVPVLVREVTMPVTGETLPLNLPLPTDQFVAKDFTPTLAKEITSSQPYWLRQPATLGTFAVDDQMLIGLPENPASFPVDVTLRVGEQDIRYRVETKYRRVDPIIGEVRQDLVIAPPVFANLSDPAYVFGDDKPKSVQVHVVAATGAVRGQLRLEAPGGWQIEPASVPFDLKSAENENSATFTVKPPPNASEGTLRAVVTVDGRDYSFSRERISYPHIGLHVLMPPAEAKIVRADIRTKGVAIGYIPGAGDEIPQSLQQIGYNVKVLEPDEMTAESLKNFDAVVLGIRAYNTQDRIANWQPQLLAYVKAGGVVVAQYNTTSDLKTKEIGPALLEISRDRVTDETAEVRILAPDHPLMNSPNKITAEDFKGWVQERGLYFSNKWDPAWTPILSCNDPGEKALDGGLLVAKSGNGYFIYTGYSWFRQLPAGVPGAYRLFANMVSLRDAK
ncbi:MAG: LmbE family protein [Verrucomicrobia bacterium]|nr:MAG: LmbE family protein [Verrucomicrobiota bacterium]